MRTTTIAALLIFATTGLGQTKTEVAQPAEKAQTAEVCSFGVPELLKMDKCQLLDLYLAGRPGVVPQGYTPGRAMLNPGKRSNETLSKMVKATSWQGKYFADDIMTNKQFGMKTAKGHVCAGISMVDAKPAHIIDYSESWRVWQPYRDEFREVSPGIYLGIMWKVTGDCPKFVSYFALDARNGCCQQIEAK